MNRFPLRVALPALGGVGAAVALLAVLLTGSAPAALSRGAVLDHSTTGKASVITVIAGKPSELAFKLSKTSNVPVGTITFKVTNLGVAFHNFKVCTIPVPTAAGAKNACFGQVDADAEARTVDDAHGPDLAGRQVRVPVHDPRPRCGGDEGAPRRRRRGGAHGAGYCCACR